MGYLHIENLYKNTAILLFGECFALEKIHGTSANVRWDGHHVTFSSGGGKHETFCALFDADALTRVFTETVAGPGVPCAVFGEFYGGGDAKGQGMSATYGKVARFVAFDVKIGETWLAVPNMADVCGKLGIDVVHFDRIPTTAEAIDAARDADSVQAVRNGCGPGKMREGVVLRPLVEMTDSRGNRIIVKHKRAEFSERKTQPAAFDPAKQAVLTEAQAIADEWVVPMRLTHVLDKLDPPAEGMQDTARVINAMISDVYREAKGEIVNSREAKSAIGRKAAQLFHATLLPV